jgi:predicted oxidoreductase
MLSHDKLSRIRFTQCCLRDHPAAISPIIGSTNPAQIATARHALELEYTREDWYRLLEARNAQAVP